MTRATLFLAVLGVLASLLMLPVAPAAAQDQSVEEQKAQLRERFKERYPTLQALENQGVVGETERGLAELVKPDAADRKADPSDKDSPTIAVFLAAENKDRTTLYGLLAKELRTTPEKVARRDALRRFEKADPSHWLYTSETGWVQKRDLKDKKK